MKKIFHRLACAFVVLIFSRFASADDFKSEVITPGGCTATCPIHVPGDKFMVIRNFTQENGTSNTRGVVMVSKNGGSFVSVLSAAFVDTTTNTPDIINNVVIAGPADVMVTCGTRAGNCFISYKKDSN